jgi:hypothetical protein
MRDAAISEMELWGGLKSFLLILLLLLASAIALCILSVSAGSNIPMQLALNGESETERAMTRPTPILTIYKDDEPPTVYSLTQC